MKKHVGTSSIQFEQPIAILAAAATVGPKEGEGPLSKYFDVLLPDMLYGEETWEKAESKMVKENMTLAVQKANRTMEEMDYVIAGDLLNQTTASTYGVRDFQRPFFGVYGACSSFGEGLGFGSILIDGGFATHVLVGASSHFCTAEKQFRSPLELGSQRTPSASWTVTGDGAVVLAKEGDGPFVTGITTGIIVDLGVKDPNNMGAAMAPAAADTLVRHFQDFNRTPKDYDLIITGDLGYIGRELVVKLVAEKGYTLGENYTDCGIQIFDREQQDTHAGGSGCACSATTFSGYIFQKLKEKILNRVLFIPTGSLQSPVSVLQGESIPGIAHGVVVESGKGR